MSIDPLVREFQKDVAERDARIASLERQLGEAQKDARRFQWCQDNWFQAQALFWNHTSRKDRVKAIDKAMETK